MTSFLDLVSPHNPLIDSSYTIFANATSFLPIIASFMLIYCEKDEKVTGMNCFHLLAGSTYWFSDKLPMLSDQNENVQFIMF